jgi:hypothetical protein
MFLRSLTYQQIILLPLPKAVISLIFLLVGIVSMLLYHAHDQANKIRKKLFSGQPLSLIGRS